MRYFHIIVYSHKTFVLSSFVRRIFELLVVIRQKLW